MKHLKKYSQMNESISDAIIITYLVLFLKWRELTPRHLLNNTKLMMIDFCKFMNGYGYNINTDMLDYKFQQLVDKAFGKIEKDEKV
jgi:hypothetical protein